MGDTVEGSGTEATPDALTPAEALEQGSNKNEGSSDAAEPPLPPAQPSTPESVAAQASTLYREASTETWEKWQQIVMWVGLALLTAVGAYYRFHLLELKPMHHDEGVNGWFIYRILDEGHYKYNPKNYHGPLLYFLHTIAVLVGGRTVAAMRFMPALFGTLAIPAMALLRRPLGMWGVWVAAAFVAVAPVEVYFSRTAIHEIYNFTFNGLLIGGAASYLLTRRRPYLILTFASLICLFATKETTIITVIALIGATVVTFVLGRVTLDETVSVALADGILSRVRGLEVRPDTEAPRGRETPLGRIGDEFFGWVRQLWLLCKLMVMADRRSFFVSSVVALTIWALLFSSLLTKPQGLAYFFAAFVMWGDTGVDGKGHQKVWYYFFTHLLWPYYRPMLFFGLSGLLWRSLKRERFSVFVLSWFVLAVTAYSIIHYKTPWCVLSFTTPLFIGVGVMARHSLDAIRRGGLFARAGHALVTAGMLASLYPVALPLPSTWQAWLAPPRRQSSELSERIKNLPHRIARAAVPTSDSWTINFEEYDVKGHPFIYVQNVREYLDLINDLHGLVETAQLEGDEKMPRIMMVDAKNPMRWYLKKVGTQFWEKEFTTGAKAKIPDKVDIVCVSKKYAADAKKILGKEFMLRRYHERPGRVIDLYIKKTLWDAYQKAAEEGLVNKPSPAFENRSFSDRRSAQMKEEWSKKSLN